MVSVGLDECNHVAQHGLLSIREFLGSLQMHM
jgi:hypothetical protein